MYVQIHTNSNKRLIKSRKLYFIDCGLASYLLGISSPEIMNRDKMRGYLFENMVISQSIKNCLNEGRDPQLYFYRDSNGNKVDLLERKGDIYDCMEIKSSETFHPQFAKGIESFSKSFPQLTGEKKIIYAGKDMGKFNDIEVLNHRTALVTTGYR